MSAGAPVVASKKTLCATPPNANVTVWPAAIESVAGVNASAVVAATVRASPGSGAVIPLLAPVPLPLPLHAASDATANSLATHSVIRESLMCSFFLSGKSMSFAQQHQDLVKAGMPLPLRGVVVSKKV